MRVIHVAPTAFGRQGLFGGGERYPLELARALAQHVSCELVTFGPEAGDAPGWCPDDPRRPTARLSRRPSGARDRAGAAEGHRASGHRARPSRPRADERARSADRARAGHRHRRDRPRPRRRRVGQAGPTSVRPDPRGVTVLGRSARISARTDPDRVRGRRSATSPAASWRTPRRRPVRRAVDAPQGRSTSSSGPCLPTPDSRSSAARVTTLDHLSGTIPRSCARLRPSGGSGSSAR